MASRRTRIAILALIGALVLFYLGRVTGLFAAGAEDAPRLYGNVEVREVELGFRVGGRLAELLVDEGD